MSVALKPCRGCPVKAARDVDCLGVNKVMRDRVANLGLRSASFDCGVLKRYLSPGRRVQIKVPEFEQNTSWDEGDGVSRTGSRVVNATVVAVMVDRVAVVIDKADMDPEAHLMPEGFNPDKGRFRKLMPHTRIVGFLDEPNRKFCDFSKQILPDGTCDRRADEICHCAEAKREAERVYP